MVRFRYLLYCLIFKVLFLSFLDRCPQAALLFYHISVILSSFFESFLFLSFRLPQKRLIYYIISLPLCQDVFSSFFVSSFLLNGASCPPGRSSVAALIIYHTFSLLSTTFSFFLWFSYFYDILVIYIQQYFFLLFPFLEWLFGNELIIYLLFDIIEITLKTIIFK